MRDVRRARARGKGLSKLLPASLLLTLTPLACQPDNSAVGDPLTEIRDSADIRIIENPRPPDSSRLDWGSAPSRSCPSGRPMAKTRTCCSLCAMP